MRDRCDIERASSHAPEVKAEQTVVNVIGELEKYIKLLTHSGQNIMSWRAKSLSRREVVGTVIFAQCCAVHALFMKFKRCLFE